MAKVINLNRFRKKKAKEEKERRAETNRRLHGRTKGERAIEEAEKKRMEKKLQGAFLVRERVDVEKLHQEADAGQKLEALEQAAEKVLSLSEFSARLRQLAQEESSTLNDPDPKGADGCDLDSDE